MLPESGSRAEDDKALRRLLPLVARGRSKAIPTDDEREIYFEPILSHVNVHMAQGHLKAAGELLKILENFVQGDPEREYRLARKRIAHFEATGQTSKALKLLVELFEQVNRSRKNPARAAELLMDRGILLERTGSKKEALVLFKNAAERYKRMKNASNLSAAIYNVASVLYSLGEHEQSLKSCFAALAAGGHRHRQLAPRVALQMANCHEALGELDSAQDAFREASKGYAQMRNHSRESDILYRLGWMCLKQSRLKESGILLSRALELKREIDYATGSALYHLDRAEGLLSAGLRAKAVSHYRVALSIAGQAGLEGICTRAKFGLFRCCSNSQLNLSAYLSKLPIPEVATSYHEKARAGLYLHYRAEGGASRRYQGSLKKPPSQPDRSPLARLIHDLARVKRALGQPNSEGLAEQSRAILAWNQNHSQS